MQKKPEALKFSTQAQVNKLRLPEGKAEAWAFDEGCTGLSIRLKGKKATWVVWLPSVGGKRPKMTLADVVSLPLAGARVKCGRHRGDAKDGKSPLAERAAAKARAADTFGALVDLYLERAKSRQRPRTYAETERYLLKHLTPLHGRPVASVTRRDIAARLEEISGEHGPIAANRARSYLNGCYSWAVRRGLVEDNPVIGTEAPGQETKRDRVLSPAELVSVWKACEGQGEFGVIVRLLMLLGARRDEVAGLRWSEIDLSSMVWTLPGSRSKNRRQHEVPLQQQAVALLADRAMAGEFVFTSRGGRRVFSGYSSAKHKLDKALGQAVEPWTLHDLRRSCVTHMVEMGIAPHVVEAAINHVSGHKGGVAGVYNRAVYREPKKAALQAWADHLEALVAGRTENNVIALAG